MRVEDIITPGIIPSGQTLRNEVVKAINYVTVASSATGYSQHAAGLAAFFTAAAARATAFAQPPTGVTLVLDTGAASAKVGASTVLKAIVAPAGAAQDVTWVSSAPAVATVNELGVVTRLTAGTTNITAKSAIDATKVSTATVITVTE